MRKYKYLRNQNITNILYPLNLNNNIRSDEKSYIITNYLNHNNIKIENHITNMFNELITLHINTKFKVKLSKAKSRKKLEDIYYYLDYKFNSLELYVKQLESQRFNEYSIVVLKNYYIFLDLRKYIIELQKKIILDVKNSKSVEMCFIHNNPKIEHFIESEQGKYFISIDNGRIGICSVDIAKFYIENEHYNLDLETMIKDYFNAYDDEFYYNYFCFIVILYYLKSLKLYNNDYVTAQNVISISERINKFKSSFLEKSNT